MTVQISIALLLTTLLVATRLAPLFLFAPPLSSIPWPTSVRMVTVFSLSLAVVLLLPVDAGIGPGIEPIQLLRMVLIEAVSGAFMAFGLVCAFGAISVAGRIMDMQIGFGLANIFDPVTNRQGPILGSALAMLAGAVFFATDSHLLFFRLFADSLAVYPPGAAFLDVEASGVLAAKQVARMFVTGIGIAFPVLIVILLIDAGLAMASKSMPQLGVFFLSLSVKAFVGLVTLAMLLVMNPGVLTRAIWNGFTYLTTLLQI